MEINIEGYQNLKKEIGDKVILVAVSKTKSVEAIKELYHLGHRDFGGAGRAEREAVLDRALDRASDVRVVVADDHRAPRADVVDVALAFDVEQIGTVGACGEERLAADRLERPDGRVDAAVHALEGAREKLVVRGHLSILL